MIPTIILILMRHYQKNNPQQFLVVKAKLLYAFKIVFFIGVAFIIAMVTRAQEKNLLYTVKKNGNKIGYMHVKENREGSIVRLSLKSDIKTSFIIRFSAVGIEEAKYDNGILVSSFVYQKLNGTEKINKQIRYVNGGYVINSKGIEEALTNEKIYYNLLCIYNHEPFQSVLIFSDKYQKFLPIYKIGEHHYRIKFPEGSANDYWFENGVCKKIEVDHAFYSVIMELNQ
jgi:hypothetical protein